MNYTNLSFKELENISIQTAKEISEKSSFDLIIYIAKSGFLIAYHMNNVFQCTLLGIEAVRRGGRIKSAVAGLVTYLPRFVRDILFTIEFKLRVHQKYSERHVKFHESVQDIDSKVIRSILLVDDSIDTGNSMKQAVEKVQDRFPLATIKIYALNVFKESRQLINADYNTYQDTIIRSPMSKDSKEYHAFCAIYAEKTENGYL